MAAQILASSRGDGYDCHPCRQSSRRMQLIGWWRGVVVSGVRRMNEVNPRRARLLPGWVTVFGRVYRLGV